MVHQHSICSKTSLFLRWESSTRCLVDYDRLDHGFVILPHVSVDGNNGLGLSTRSIRQPDGWSEKEDNNYYKGRSKSYGAKSSQGTVRISISGMSYSNNLY